MLSMKWLYLMGRLFVVNLSRWFRRCIHQFLFLTYVNWAIWCSICKNSLLFLLIYSLSFSLSLIIRCPFSSRIVCAVGCGSCLGVAVSAFVAVEAVAGCVMVAFVAGAVWV